ncbi:carbohydrate-binding protein [Archangium violaceum]|uniref:carbohydrate-binding protein n=1 Tax=Archangium violaceum TaxID=83451 RepID=UPI00193B4AAD|nr:carbohydrate-binding protein [Archangium violaceum]QRK12918.1 carbohydrate-binding protein [Archangium violaceum]
MNLFRGQLSRLLSLGLVMSAVQLLPGTALAARTPYYQALVANTYDAQSGTRLTPGPNGEAGGAVGSFDDGDWIKFAEVDFEANGPSSYQLIVALPDHEVGGSFEIRLDRPTGQLLDVLHVSSTGGWNNFTTQYGSTVPVAGVHDVYIVARGKNAVGNIHQLLFIKSGTVHTLNPFSLSGIWARDYNDQSGTTLVTSSGTQVVSDFDDGDWIQFSGMDFGSTGASQVWLTVAAPHEYAGQQLELRLNSPTGQLIGTHTVTGTGGWDTWSGIQSSSVTPVPGIHTLYIVGSGQSKIANIRGFLFVPARSAAMP